MDKKDEDFTWLWDGFHKSTSGRPEMVLARDKMEADMKLLGFFEAVLYIDMLFPPNNDDSTYTC